MAKSADKQDFIFSPQSALSNQVLFRVGTSCIYQINHMLLSDYISEQFAVEDEFRGEIHFSNAYPVKRKHQVCVGLMLDQRRRLWLSIKT